MYPRSSVKQRLGKASNIHPSLFHSKRKRENSLGMERKKSFSCSTVPLPAAYFFFALFFKLSECLEKSSPYTGRVSRLRKRKILPTKR